MDDKLRHEAEDDLQRGSRRPLALARQTGKQHPSYVWGLRQLSVICHLSSAWPLFGIPSIRVMMKRKLTKSTLHRYRPEIPVKDRSRQEKRAGVKERERGNLAR